MSGMKKRLGIWGSLSLVLALVMTALPATSFATTYPISLTDDLGRTVTVSNRPMRIVSLAPSNTEILFELGLGDRLVGVTDFCDYPADALGKDKVGGPWAPSAEKVVALQPDLVLAAGINPIAVVTGLEQLGLTVFGIEATNLADLLHDIETVGRLTDRETEAKAPTDRMQRRIEEITSQIAGLSSGQKPRTLYICWHDPIWTTGQDTFTNDLIQRAGGANIFHDLAEWQMVSLETVLTRDPEVIIVTAMGGVASQTWTWVNTEPRLRDTSARKNGRIYYVESNWVERPGPRVLLGLEALARYFHPEISLLPRQAAESREHIVGYGVPQRAVALINQIVTSSGAEEAVSILDKVRRERAAYILGELDLETRTALISLMSEQTLKETLPALPLEKLYEIPPQKLFEKLPSVPAEQLIRETPPVAPAYLTPPKAIEGTAMAIYRAPEARAGEWVSLFSGSPDPFVSLMVKPNKELKDVEASVEERWREAPPGAELLPGYPYLSLHWDIRLRNISAENIEAAHLTFKLMRQVLDFLGHSEWSTLLNRWDSAAGQWVSIPTKRIKEDSEFVYYSAVVPHFSLFTITGSRDIPPPSFEVSNLTLPAEVVAGQEVTIGAEVVNRTERAQTCVAVLWINSMAEKASEVAVPAGGKARLSFTVVKSTPGEYQVRIDRLMSQFAVREAPPTVAAALATIAGEYTIVWGYDAAAQAWTKHDPAAPSYANTLSQLVAGQGYWVQVSEEAKLSCGAKEWDLKKGCNLITW